MAYIGKQPVVGNFVKLDAIVTSATATYNLLNGGVAYSPQSANNCIVSLNGVIQEPTSSGNVGGYTISGSTIVFTSALTSLDVIDFILVLGDTLSIGTPSDGTVGFAKITSNLITGATAETTIAGGDSVLIYDDSASALRKMTRTNFVSGITGGILQVKQTYKTDSFNTSASTLTDVTGLSVTITPTSATSKILVFTHVSGAARASAGGNVRLLRGSTQIGLADAASNRSLSSLSGNLWITSDHDAARSMCGMFLDAPATTSSTTYKIQVKNGSGGATNINRTNNDTDAEDSPGRMTSSITVFEIASSILT
jgi:hypothetical protein